MMRGGPAAKCEHDDVDTVQRGNPQRAAAEALLDARDTALQTRVVRHEIGEQYPRIAQRGEGRIVKRPGAQRAHLLAVLEGVEHQHIGARGTPRHEDGAVADEHGEALVVRGKLEELPRRRDDLGVDLGHGHARLRHALVHEPRDRAASQADHQHLARLPAEEQERHHRAGVVQLEPVGRIQAHRALDRRAARVQLAHASRLADLDCAVAAGQPLAQAPHASPRSLTQPAQAGSRRSRQALAAAPSISAALQMIGSA